jgi:hypothetical protein
MSTYTHDENLQSCMLVWESQSQTCTAGKVIPINVMPWLRNINMRAGCVQRCLMDNTDGQAGHCRV